MIVTTHQPIFLPWPGFFYKALCADTMVLLDDVQFPQGRGWMNRNRVKCDQGELWLTVPVWKKGKGKQLIRDVEICYEADWRRRHMRTLRQCYANAPYREHYLPAIESLYARRYPRLSDFNIDLIRLLWDALGIPCRLLVQSQLGVSGRGTDLLIGISRALNADAYVTLPLVEKHLDTQRFAASGVELLFEAFKPPIYPQLWGEFRFNLSTLDLLLSCGPQSLHIVAQAGSRRRRASDPPSRPEEDSADTPAAPKEIFVFGSDLAGRHTSGDALTALRKHGAIYGHAVGIQGRSYAIPVRDENGRLLPVAMIARYVQAFLRFAATHKDLRFYVTRIGCGRDAHHDEQIAPLFAKAPSNCRLPPRWGRHATDARGKAAHSDN
jgi:hypothetical protein